MHRPAVLWTLSAALSVLPFASASGADDRPNGWAQRITQTDVDLELTAPRAAFALDAGESLHPEARASGWTAEYDTVLAITDAGAYRFTIVTEGGEASIVVRSMAGADLASASTTRSQSSVTTPSVTLAPGEAQVIVTYKRGARGNALLDTLWEMTATDAGFRPEPIPSGSTHPPAGRRSAIATGDGDRAGRTLLQSKGCTNCHAAPPAAEHAISRRVAPDLDRAGSRSSTSWLTRWISSPTKIRPHADMPALFGADDAGATADLVAYLQALADPYPGDTAAKGAQEIAGRDLFHSVGCIACHGARTSPAALSGNPAHSSDVPTHDPVVPYGDLSGRWTKDALSAFLREPTSVMRDGRMPDFHLTETESTQISAYLMATLGAGGPIEPASTGDAARGREQFRGLGCGSCHGVEGGAPLPPTAKPLFDLDLTRGCMNAADTETPRYALSDAERALLSRGIASVKRAAGTRAPIDLAERTLADLNCRACHAQDGQGGLALSDRAYFVEQDERVDLGDEGRIPPDLSGVGFKLNTDWLTRVIDGDGIARPYMAARMPTFGEDRRAPLAHALAKRDGVVPGTDEREPASTDELTALGRDLVGSNNMNCISCHQFKDYPPAGTPGPRMDHFAERLRYAWWRSYIQNPSRFKPGTKMPSFSLGRTSHFPQRDADIYAQGDAMWCYFNLGEFMPTPSGLESPSDMKIDVGALPVVIRTFMKGAGSRAIAVGNPEGVHYAFDATAVRLVEAWRGDFLDASGAWAGRGGSEVGGLGPMLWSAPAGPSLFVGARPASWPVFTGKDAGYRFRGYHLDDAGYPTFLYDIADTRVEETIRSRLVPNPALRRSFAITDLPADTALWLNAGTSSSRQLQANGAQIVTHEVADATWYEVRAKDGAERVMFSVEVEL